MTLLRPYHAELAARVGLVVHALLDRGDFFLARAQGELGAVLGLVGVFGPFVEHAEDVDLGFGEGVGVVGGATDGGELLPGHGIGDDTE